MGAEASEEMLSMEKWATIRYLRAQGKGVRAIARELDVGRNTVRRAVEAATTPRYERPGRRNPNFANLTELAAQIAQFIAAWNQMAHPFRWRPASFAKIIAKFEAALATAPEPVSEAA